MDDGYLELRGVGKSFGRYTAIAGIDLSVARGEFVTLIGHSGCGKSTLLNLIGGLSRPSTGTIELEGRFVTNPGPDRGMVFQHHGLLPWLSVHANVYEAVDAVFPGRLAPQKQDKRERVERILRVVGLWEYRHSKPGELSGGMRQRTAVARAFAIVPRVLLLDEPFGALDALTRTSLQDELINLWSFDHSTETVLMVTHDIDEAIYLSDRIVVMTNGPRATIREVVKVALPRPRERRAMLHTARYADLKAHLLDLLAEKAVVGVA
jgi:nitrate/nitrite transport system ATP-binding protein